MNILAKSVFAQQAVDGVRPLLIKRIDAFPVALPLRKPMKMAGANIEHTHNLIVRIEAESGDVGWGEAASAPTMTGDTLGGMVAAVRSVLSPVLIGKDARFPALISDLMAHAIFGNTGARAAIEIALIDMIGRATKLSAVDLFGGRRRNFVSPMWLLGNSTVESDLQEAREKYSEGYCFFKLKVGVKKIDEDIRATLQLRQQLPENTILCADANMGFTGETAQRYLEAVADSGLCFLEQPLPYQDIERFAELSRSTRIPLCADEGIHSIPDVLRHLQCGIGGVSLKFIKLGGVFAMMDAVRICEENDAAINIAGKIAESGIGSAANMHISCATNEVDWGTSLTHVYLSDDLVTTPMKIENGKIGLMDGAGLGVDVSEERVHSFTMKQWSDV